MQKNIIKKLIKVIGLSAVLTVTALSNLKASDDLREEQHNVRLPQPIEYSEQGDLTIMQFCDSMYYIASKEKVRNCIGGYTSNLLAPVIMNLLQHSSHHIMKNYVPGGEFIMQNLGGISDNLVGSKVRHFTFLFGYYSPDLVYSGLKIPVNLYNAYKSKVE